MDIHSLSYLLAIHSEGDIKRTSTYDNITVADTEAKIIILSVGIAARKGGQPNGGIRCRVIGAVKNLRLPLKEVNVSVVPFVLLLLLVTRIHV